MVLLTPKLPYPDISLLLYHMIISTLPWYYIYLSLVFHWFYIIISTWAWYLTDFILLYLPEPDIWQSLQMLPFWVLWNASPLSGLVHSGKASPLYYLQLRGDFGQPPFSLLSQMFWSAKNLTWYDYFRNNLSLKTWLDWSNCYNNSQFSCQIWTIHVPLILRGKLAIEKTSWKLSH